MSIVNIAVSVTTPPKPSNLLKTGALVSVGGTTLDVGGTSLLTAYSDLAAIKAASIDISSMTYNAGTVEVTTASAHGWTDGSDVKVVITGAVPDAYNGTYDATVGESNTFTYNLATNPGTVTTEGSVQAYAAVELDEMGTSFFAQGSNRSVYVLELGQGTSAAAVAELKTLIAADIALGNTSQVFFSYLVPRAFDTEATFKTLCGLYTSPQYMLNFFVTTTINTYAAWVPLAQKSVELFVESPDMPSGVFDCAAFFQSSLANNPGSSSRVPPMSYRFMYGTTVYPAVGNGALFTALKAANVSYIGSGAEGGLSNMILNLGHAADGKPFGYWYSVAWCILNLNLNLANEIINGSNNTVNPLYYNQPGIDRLQKRALATTRSGISYGLLLGTAVNTKLTQEVFNENYDNGDYNGEAVVNAIPFSDYIADNPDAYSEMDYGGLSAVVTPLRGFESITFNLSVTDFVG